MNRTSENGMDGTGAKPAAWLRGHQPLVNQLFADSGAASWGLSRPVFTAALETSVQKHFHNQPPSHAQLQTYLSSLHLGDLALACACAAGLPAAWDYFVATFRAYLRSAAGAILRCPPDSPASCELADSLFADLYGLSDAPHRRSLFRYFHGRSSLKTWLRAVLAQRHIDSIRATRRFTELEGSDGHADLPASPRASLLVQKNAADGQPPDPHRAELVALFRRTLEVALGLLDPRDRERLRLYYAAQHTLAEIGRHFGEHESSVSRHLDRIRRELRLHVEQALRKTAPALDGAPPSAGLSEAQILLCFEYAAEDVPIDLDKLLPPNPLARRKPESKKP